MTATKSFSNFKKCLAKHLKSVGFVGAGDIFWQKANDTLVVLEVQKDRKRRTKDEILFTINLGISVDALRSDAFSEAPTTEGPLPVESCHWRQRLGRLLPSHADIWWSLRDEHTSQAVCEEITAALFTHALPSIHELASSASLLRLWREDHGQGLTEYERRSNLARLLLALNRIAETKTAIRALEDASIGKSWEGSARYFVTQLRNKLKEIESRQES